MKFSAAILFCACVSVSLAAMLPPSVNEVGDDKDDKPTKCQHKDGLSDRDVEMVDITRAVDEAMEKLSEDEQALLDDLLQAGIDAGNSEEAEDQGQDEGEGEDEDEDEQDGGRVKRAPCEGCSITCVSRKGVESSCSASGCRAKCKCTLFGRRAKCRSRW